MKLIIKISILFLFSLPLLSIERLQIEELTYIGPPAENWLVAGIRSTVTNDLRRVSSDHEFEVITVEDQNEALKTATEKRKGGAKINLTDEVAKILAVDYRCVGSVQNINNVVRVNLRLLKGPDFKVWKSTTTDKKKSDLLELQNQVVFNLLKDIDGKINDEQKKVIEISRPKNQSAYEFYAKGLKLEFTDPKEALNYFSKAIEVDENYVDALLKAGQISYSPLSQKIEAQNYFEKVESILQTQGKQSTSEYAFLMHQIGRVSKGNIREEFYNKSKSVYETLGLKNTKGYADILSDIGYNEGNLEYLFEAKNILENIGLKKSLLYCQVLSPIASVYDDKYENTLKAMEYYLLSKSIMESMGFQNTYVYGYLLNNIGTVTKDKDEELEYFLKAKSVYDKLGLHKTNGYAMMMNNIGANYFNRDKLSTASEYFLKAKSIYEANGEYSSSGYKMVERNLEKLYEAKRK